MSRGGTGAFQMLVWTPLVRIIILDAVLDFREQEQEGRKGGREKERQELVCIGKRYEY